MAPCYDGPLQKATPERRIPMDLPFSHCLVYVTAADEAEAQAIGRAMVEARLAACANVLPGMVPFFRWEDRVQTDPATGGNRKTHRDRAPAVVVAVAA